MLAAVLLALAVSQTPCPDGAIQEGWLWPKTDACQRPIPYVPREGDVVLLTSRVPYQFVSYAIARSTHPYHSGVIVRRCDGSLAILESGGGGDMRVTIRPIGERFVEYTTKLKQGSIWVRQIRCPLTPEESRRLTNFAEAQLGKKFAGLGRLALLWVPGRIRYPVSPDSDVWMCSSIVAEALIQMGRVPADAITPSIVFPRQLFYSTGAARAMDNGWAAAARWTECPTPPPPAPPHAPQ